MFGTQAEMDSFQEKLTECGADVNAIFKLFEENENTAGYFNILTTQAEKFNAVLSVLQDETQQLAVSAQSSGLDALNNIVRLEQMLGSSQEETQNSAQGIFDRISEMGLYDDEFIQLTAMIADEESIKSINEGLDRIEKSGDLNDFKVHAELSEEELREQTLASTQNYSENNMEASVDIETAKIFGEYLAKNGADVEGYSDELKTNADALHEVVEAQGRYDAALKETADSYED